MTKAPFVIAEAGVNHNGDLRRALKMVDAAASAGADAVKFQTFRAELLASASAPRARYQKGRGGQIELLRRLELSEDAHRALLRRCRARGIEFMSTPFDEGSADFLASLGMRRFKVASGELTNLPLIRHIARKGRPMIISTGMSHLREVRDAVYAARAAGARELTLLHCVSAYPTPPSEANLLAMRTLAEAFSLPIGWSDHTLSLELPVAATALGAAVIEKHFTLDRRLPGPDHAASLLPGELAAMVRSVALTASALGDGIKMPSPCELDVLRVARRSVVLARPVRRGEKLQARDLVLKRPGTGIPPAELPYVVRRRVLRDLAADTILSWELLW